MRVFGILVLGITCNGEEIYSPSLGGKWRQAWDITARLELKRLAKLQIFAIMQQTMYLKQAAYYNDIC